MALTKHPITEDKIVWGALIVLLAAFGYSLSAYYGWFGMERGKDTRAASIEARKIIRD